METFLNWLGGLSWQAAALFTAAGNVFVFFAALIFGRIAQRKWANNRVADPAPPLTMLEVLLAISNVLLSAAVTFAGWVMWTQGLIVLRPSGPGYILLETTVLFVVMDFTMYVLHRMAHIPWLYPWMHALHHRYENPRPLTLFVMHPLETVSFGVLWLVVITSISFLAGGISFASMMIYLSANAAFGLCGHLGVQPFPARIMQLPGIRWLAGSEFHAVHHADDARNFGFYSRIWDHLLKTDKSARSHPPQAN